MLASRSMTLANGLHLITVPQPHLHSATVCVAVHCGARHESAAQWGLSHFLEHMLFRGSSRFADGRAVAHVFERGGGGLQAATWRDHTAYTASFHPSHVRPVLAAVADIMQTPHFGGIDVERTIVEEELGADLDEDGNDVDMGNISRARIWPGHPMGRRITGSMATLHTFTTRDLRQHHQRHYTGRNTVVCVAGRIESREVEALSADVFGSMPAHPTVDNGPAPRFTPREPLAIVARPGSQVGMQLAFEAPADTHPDFWAAAILASILDDGMTSRLPHALCERRGLVYELGTGLDCYSDCGIYDIEMQVAPQRAAAALEVTVEVLYALLARGCTAEELEEARQRHMHALEFRIDSTEEVAQEFAVSRLFDRSYDLHADMEKIEAVSLQDLSRVARRLFCSGRVHITLIGAVKRADMGRIEKLVSDLRGLGNDVITGIPSLAVV